MKRAARWLNKGAKRTEMREASPSKRPDQLQANMKGEAVFRAGAPVPGQVKTMLPKTTLLESRTAPTGQRCPTGVFFQRPRRELKV